MATARERLQADLVVQVDDTKASASITGGRSPKDAGKGSSTNTFLSLRQSCVTLGLLLECPAPSGQETCTAIQDRGISLAWLKQLLVCLSKAGLPADSSTEQVVTRYLQPMLKSSSNCRQPQMWESINPEHCGKAEYFIVHAWQCSFKDMVKAVSHRLDPPPVPNQPPPPPVDTNKLYIWLDFVVAPQGPGIGQSLLESGVVREAINGCKGGALVLVDPDLLLLKRAWCLMEVFLTIYLLPSDKLQVVLPAMLELETGPQLQAAVSAADLGRAETSRPEDKLQIVREVKHTIGMQRMQQMLSDGLSRSARVALRWGGMQRLCVYCALLLSKGEFGLLYLVLSLVPELQLEDTMLEEILTLFKLYDTDGSGELDLDEFVKALNAAGISEEEAAAMYRKCNADGGDGVSIAEFEKWWVDNQGGGGGGGGGGGSSSKTLATAESLTMKQLLQSLDAYMKLLQRTPGLERYVPYFMDWIKRLEKGVHSKLTMPPTRGDWKHMIEQMNWKLANDDVKGAGQMLYLFLINNAEMLDTDLALLPVFDPTVPRSQQYKPVHTYLELLVSMLRWYPSRKREEKMLAELARKYRLIAANACDDRLPIITGQGNKKNFTAKSDKFIFQIISKMVHLKYGEQYPMGQQVITSAMRALSRWMAQTRKTPQGNYDAICQFSSEYLAALDTESEFSNVSTFDDHDSDETWAAEWSSPAAPSPAPSPTRSSTSTQSLASSRLGGGGGGGGGNLPSESFLPSLNSSRASSHADSEAARKPSNGSPRMPRGADSFSPRVAKEGDLVSRMLGQGPQRSPLSQDPVTSPAVSTSSTRSKQSPTGAQARRYAPRSKDQNR